MARTKATHSPVSIAREVSKHRTANGQRPVTDKQVRGRARTVLSAYSKGEHPEYQRHSYSDAERRTLLAAFGIKVAAPRRPRSKAPSAPASDA